MVNREEAAVLGKPFQPGVTKPPPGARVVMRDGTNYNVAKDGSFRNLTQKLNKAERKRAKRQKVKLRNKLNGQSG